jgi:hypothetical protein
MVNQSRVTVTTAATRLDAPVAYDISPLSVLIRNRGTVASYLGGSDVTSNNGYQLDPGETISFDLIPGEALYAITASGTAVHHVIQTGA